MNHKPIGGVQSVTLQSAQSGSISIAVPLIDDSSVYQQSVEPLESLTVRHTLTLVARRNDAEAWLSESFVQRAACGGFVAEVVLNDGRRYSVGDSSAPVYLIKLLSDSKMSAAGEPTVTLTLCCENNTLN